MKANTGSSIDVRRLELEDIELIRKIDRSEHIDTLYLFEHGQLRSEPADIDVPPWDAEGDGEHSSAVRIADLRPLVESGAALLGGFAGGDFAGIAVVDPTFEGSLAWFTFLHVSRPYRRRGVAAALWEAGIEVAKAANASSIYVSATPSGSAVGFYTSRGCRLASPPHPMLFAEEPEDIHFICPLA